MAQRYRAEGTPECTAKPMLSSEPSHQRQRDSLAFLGAITLHALVGLALLSSLQPQRPQSEPLRLVELRPNEIPDPPSESDLLSTPLALRTLGQSTTASEAPEEPPEPPSAFTLPDLPALQTPPPPLSTSLLGAELPRSERPRVPSPTSLATSAPPPTQPEPEPTPDLPIVQPEPPTLNAPPLRSAFPTSEPPDRPASTILPRPVAPPAQPAAPPIEVEDFQTQLGQWLASARQKYEASLIPRRIDLKPAYPAAACPDRLQGLAILPVVVDPEGQPVAVPLADSDPAELVQNRLASDADSPPLSPTLRLLQSTGHSLLDETALQTVRRYRFEATGQHQAILFVLNFRYALENCMAPNAE